MFMKRFVTVLTALSLLLLVGGSALADHKAGHAPGGGGGGGQGGGQSETPSCQKGSKGQDQNKHCYPPGPTKPTSTGADIVTQPAEAGGLSVGMATIMAIGALGALLLVRRRWVFRTARR